jgi:hypothetical protein
MGIEGYIDIPEAAFLTDVGYHHGDKMIPAFEMLCVIISFMLVHNTLKFVSGKQTQKLG